MTYHSGGDQDPYGGQDSGPTGGAARTGGKGVPDSLLVGALGVVTSVTLLTWSSTGIAGWLQHGAWPDGVTFTRTAVAVRSFFTAPSDIPGAWPAADEAALPGASLLWLAFFAQLFVVFATVLALAFRYARWRSGRPGRVGRTRRGTGAPAAAGLEKGGDGSLPPEDGHSPARGATEAVGPPDDPATATPGTAGVAGGAAGAEVPDAEPTVRLPYVTAGAATSSGQVAPGAPAASAVLRAPAGAVVVDPDGRLWEQTARQRGRKGPVHVYDPEHLTDAPVRLRWAPQHGCADLTTARQRAVALLSTVRPVEPVFRLDAETAETLLRCYLHAAALTGQPIQQVQRWAMGKSSGDPAKTLRTHQKAAPGASMELESALSAHPGRRDTGQALISKALRGLDQLHIRQTCAPGRVDTLALDNVAAEGGTLYVVGRTADTAPFRTALLEAVPELSRVQAAAESSGR
ncbi:type VI secretion protein [Streptomyces sp. ACA25]|uniref:type VI secretion protein n=1 Tax=Streptomyces sp. ACA25 TaxID=3022596 RepID=UPI0023077934|nr:type VI secretion protein [Streptomyces sp. ACA25]MDB1090215.1 type VI secretion protein [Streptomyces sp. ACA25]